MLIDSPRLSDADRAAWQQQAVLDRRMADRLQGRLERLADTARQVIADFAAAGPCYAGTSWGKDSTIVAHLVATSPVADRVPLIWFRTVAWRTDRVDNPDAPAVRDVFLTRFPHVRYAEDSGGPRELEQRHGGRYISGVRAAESSTRRMAMRAHGVATDRTCRPIGHWTDTDVWAYLTLHDLPIHPAYAMTYGGMLDRSRLRVHRFGSQQGGYHGRLEWERCYYPDVWERLAAAGVVA